MYFLLCLFWWLYPKSHQANDKKMFEQYCKNNPDIIESNKQITSAVKKIKNTDEDYSKSHIGNHKLKLVNLTLASAHVFTDFTFPSNKQKCNISNKLIVILNVFIMCVFDNITCHQFGFSNIALGNIKWQHAHGNIKWQHAHGNIKWQHAHGNTKWQHQVATCSWQHQVATSSGNILMATSSLSCCQFSVGNIKPTTLLWQYIKLATSNRAYYCQLHVANSQLAT